MNIDKNSKADYISGSQLVMYDELPFSQLKQYDMKLLDSIELVMVPNNNKFLNRITLVDTPGVLSSYSRWQQYSLWKSFFEQSHMIILLFDEKSCDFSDEMVALLQGLDTHLEKTRFVLNKADSLTFVNY